MTIMGVVPMDTRLLRESFANIYTDIDTNIDTDIDTA